MNNYVKHLYIHIPFCNHICSYCDFARIKTNDQSIKKEYIKKVIENLRQKSVLHQYSTIYIGGGTPNALENELLEELLLAIQPYMDDECEFSIECNPELVTEQNVALMKKYHVNRVSLGVQTTNNQILKQINRKHTIEDVKECISLFHQYGIVNLSVDFIYNLMNLSWNDIDESINFLVENDIKHVSYYALEIKNGSLLKKMNIKIDEEVAEEQLQYIIQKLKDIGFVRYEVSNWSLNNKYQCKHNVEAYWKFNEWIGIGYGAFGYESFNNYSFSNQILNWELNNNFDSISSYEKTYIMMNLRLVEGMDLANPYNYYLYEKYKNKLHYFEIVNNHLRCKDISLLNQTIIDIF